MLSLRSILVAAAAFATIVSAVPTPDVGSGLVQRTPQLVPIPYPLPEDGGAGSAPSLPGTGGADGLPLPLPGGPLPALPIKRGGQSCYERIKQCHDDISVIVIKIG